MFSVATFYNMESFYLKHFFKVTLYYTLYLDSVNRVTMLEFLQTKNGLF